MKTSRISILRRHPFLAIAVFVGLALRVAAILAFGPSRMEFGDSADYLACARHICECGGYPDRGNLPFFRAPGLPLLIATSTACFTTGIGSAKLALALLDSVTIVMVFGLCRLVWSQQAVALAGSVLAAIYPVFVTQITDLRTEPLFMFFLTGAFLFFLRARIDASSVSYFMCGVSLAAAALVRPVALALIGFFAIACVLDATRTPRLRFVRCASVILGSALVLAPWVAFNWVKYHELILVNNAGGYNFWRETTPEIYAIAQERDPAEFERLSLQFETVVSPRVAAGLKDADSPSLQSRLWFRLGLANIRECPGAYFRHLFHKTLTYWRPWLNPQAHSRRAVILSSFCFVSLYVSACFGFRILLQTDSRFARLLLGYLLFSCLVQVPFQVVTRFRIPFTDPPAIVLAARVLVSVAERAKRNPVTEAIRGPIPVTPPQVQNIGCLNPLGKTSTSADTPR